MNSRNSVTLVSLFTTFKDSLIFIIDNIIPVSGMMIITFAITTILSVIQAGGSFELMYNPSGSEFNSGGLISSMFILMPLYTLFIVVAASIVCLVAYAMSSNTKEMFYFKKCYQYSKNRLLTLFLGMFIKFFLVFLGTILFIIPGVIVGVALSFMEYLIIVEGKSITEAIRKSYMMTSGIFLPFAGFTAIIYILPERIIDNLFFTMLLLIIYYMNMFILYKRGWKLVELNS